MGLTLPLLHALDPRMRAAWLFCLTGRFLVASDAGGRYDDPIAIGADELRWIRRPSLGGHRRAAVAANTLVAPRRTQEQYCAPQLPRTELLFISSIGSSELVTTRSAAECCTLCGSSDQYDSWSWCEPRTGVETQGRCVLTTHSLSPAEAALLGQNTRQHAHDGCQAGFDLSSAKGGRTPPPPPPPPVLPPPPPPPALTCSPDHPEDDDCPGVVAAGVSCETSLTELDPSNAPNLTLADACFMSCGRCATKAQFAAAGSCHDVLHNCADIFARPAWPAPCVADASALHDAIPPGTTLGTLCPSFCRFDCGDDSCPFARNGRCDYRPQPHPGKTTGTVVMPDTPQCTGGTDASDCAHVPCAHESDGYCDTVHTVVPATSTHPEMVRPPACAAGTDIDDCGLCAADGGVARSIARDVAGCVNAFDIQVNRRGDGPTQVCLSVPHSFSRFCLWYSGGVRCMGLSLSESATHMCPLVPPALLCVFVGCCVVGPSVWWQSHCDQLIAAHFDCEHNFCPTCANAGYCDRSCGYCEDPCSVDPQYSDGHTPGFDGDRPMMGGAADNGYADAYASEDNAASQAAASQEGSGESAVDVLLVTLASFASFFCACTVVFAMLTRQRVNARLGVAATGRGLRGARPGQDEDVMTVNATFTGFQAGVAAAGADSDSLDMSLIGHTLPPVVVAGECGDSLGPEATTPGLGAFSLPARSSFFRSHARARAH